MNDTDSTLDDNKSVVEACAVITDEMLKEDQALENKNAREIEKKRKIDEDQQHEKEMKEQRYKRLLNLLEKSKFYANFVQRKLQGLQKDKENQKPKLARRKKKVHKLDVEECKILNAPCKKMKIEEGVKSVLRSDCQESEQSDEDSQCGKEQIETRLSSLGVEVPVDQPKLLEGGALRDYQLSGFKWLKMLYEGGINGILADEMGLGKTVQTIALICHLYEQGVPGPFLIIGPLSTLPNWSIEFKTFAPKIPVVVYYGTKSVRAELQGELIKMTNVGGRKAAPVVITSYQVSLYDRQILSKINWKFLIVDEGHRLKNFETNLFRTLQKFQTENRLLLTGTPLQNNLKELWSLLHFLIPDIFDNLDTFHSWFQIEDMQHSDMTNQVIKEEKERRILTLLHQILSPFLLRRIKADVNLNLPGKKEVHVLCPMVTFQRHIYETILESALLNAANEKSTKSLIIPDNPDGTKRKRKVARRAELYGYTQKLGNQSFISTTRLTKEDYEKKESSWMKVKHRGVVYSVMANMTKPAVALKKVANHPMLVTREIQVDNKEAQRRSEEIDDDLVSSSGKLMMLNKLLAKLKERGHKVLIFSTWTSILDVIEEMVNNQDLKYCRLDGNTRISDRRDTIYAFNRDPNIFLFLLSTRAGGLGINLTSADTVIIFDSDWNPQADLQAQDRCHRINQVKPVVVYRLITAGTIDEKIVSRAIAKRKLEKMIIQQGEFRGIDKPIKEAVDLEELKDLLSKKHHSLEVKADGNSADLTEQEWEELLDRSDLKT